LGITLQPPRYTVNDLEISSMLADKLLEQSEGQSQLVSHGHDNTVPEGRYSLKLKCYLLASFDDTEKFRLSHLYEI
jgi:hypothetical protein